MPRSREILLPWDRQPQEAVGPNPASTGLIVYCDPAIDPRVNGKFPTSNPTTPIVGANGRGLQFTGGNKKVTWAFDAGLAAAVTGPSGFTAALLFDLDAATNYGGLLSLQDTATSGAAFEIRLGASASTDTKIQVLRATSGTYRAKDTGANRFSAGDKNIVLVVSFPDNDVTSQGTAWINGTAYPLNSGAIGSATGTVGTPTTGSLVLGGRGPDSVTYLNGKVYALRIWDRELSAVEVPKTPTDMWALAAPQTVWVPVSAGAPAGISATLTQTLSDAAASAASTLALKGTVSQTLANATTTATGTLAVKGTTTLTLADATLAATGSLAVSGSGVLAVTLGDATVTSTGTVALKAAVTQTLAAATLTSTATLAIKGTTSQTLADATLSAAGVLAVAGSGTLAQTLADVAITSAGTVALKSVASVTLADTALAGTAALALKGTASKTLDDATVSAQGTAQTVTTGTLSTTLDAATLSAAAKLAISANAAPTLADAAVSASATTTYLDLTAIVTQTLGNVTSTATGAVLIKGSATVTLDDCAIVASNVPTVFTDTEWWLYVVAADDLSYSVGADSLSFRTGV